MYTKDNYQSKLKLFHQDVWDNLTIKEKEDLLQWVVDYEAFLLGWPSICSVKIEKLSGGTKIGEYDSKNNIIKIEKELAIDGLKPPYHMNNIKNYHLTRELETYGALMHEFRHAIQNYIKRHPSRNEKYRQLMIYNSDNANAKNLKMYFNINVKSQAKKDASIILYKIQPSERDAFMYRDKKMDEFLKEIHELFPEKYPSWSFNDSDFQQSVKEAKIRYETESPFEDIDNIIKVLNGESLELSLNEQMINDIYLTQQKTLLEKIETFIYRTNINLDNVADIPMNCCEEHDFYKEISDEAYEELYR